MFNTLLNWVTSTYGEWLGAYHSLSPFVRGCLQPIVFGTAYLVPIWVLERLSGGGSRHYFSRGFLQDLAYWFWHSSGLYSFIFTASLLNLLQPHLAVFQLGLLQQLPYAVRGVIFYFIAEFIAYWYHRMQHASPFLWAFHTTHHSQEHPSFATFNRFHPIDEFLMDMIPFIPLLMLGASVKDWFPLFWLHRALVVAQHSDIRWRFGPLRYFFVTPHFHSFHHSVDDVHHHRNFGATLSLWDHLFGTAVDQPVRPTAYGLNQPRMQTLAGSLLVPFRILFETYWPKAKQATGKAFVASP